MGDLPGCGGVAAAELNDLMSSVGPIPLENWAAADKAGREIIRKVQPTYVSEERRKAVLHYIQRLIKTCLGSEVFPYGSVPLKTYLPDGDIDLTVFGGTNVDDSLADDMKAVLEEEEQNTNAEFVVKDVQLIRAEVKIVKCIVQDIVVDVSFNQIGGLCTLCFLEQVDRIIGKNHLFKQSIILIKAWCYYESRILGAHHGLISTYALETMVLYIFHLYYSTLDGPLSVLYKFLEYFSKFSWETYCISLDGPLRLSSLPNVVAVMPEDSDRDLLLSIDFLNYCVGTFSVPFKDSESSRGFQRKFFNIIDPLKEINNLGRSVSRGNYYRIRSAFSYGAKKLARILTQPQHSISNELRKFFSNTMARHGGGPRPDVQDIYQSVVNSSPISANYDDSKGDFQSESDDCATSGLDGLKISTDSSTSTPNDRVDAVPVFAPHVFFSKSKQHDSSIMNDSLDSDKLNKTENQLIEKDEAVASSKMREVFRDQRSSFLLSGDSSPPETESQTDLAGDYDSYLQYLHYGRSCLEYGFGMHSLPRPPVLNPSYQRNGVWDGLLPPMHYEQNGYSHQHQNGFHPNPAIYAMPSVILQGVQYGWKDVPKPRGTGTYFPTMTVPFQGIPAQTMKGRNQASIRSPRVNGPDRSSHEQSQYQAPVDSSESYLPFSPHQNGHHHNANGLFIQPEAEVEEISRPVSSSPRTVSGTQTSKPATSKGQERDFLLTSTYHLKDEEDFPPLSSM